MEGSQIMLDLESQDPPPSYNTAIRTSLLLSTMTSAAELVTPPNPVTPTLNPPYPVTPILNRPPYPVTPDFGQPPYPIPQEYNSLGPDSRSSVYQSTEVPFPMPMPMPMPTPVRMPMPELPSSFSSGNQNFVRLLDCDGCTSPFALSPSVRNSIDCRSSVVEPLVPRMSRMPRRQKAHRRPLTSMAESSDQRKKETSCCMIILAFNIFVILVVLAIIGISPFYKSRSS